MTGCLQIPTYCFFRRKFGEFQYILDLCELMVSLTNPIVAFDTEAVDYYFPGSRLPW